MVAGPCRRSRRSPHTRLKSYTGIRSAFYSFTPRIPPIYCYWLFLFLFFSQYLLAIYFIFICDILFVFSAHHMSLQWNRMRQNFFFPSMCFNSKVEIALFLLLCYVPSPISSSSSLQSSTLGYLYFWVLEKIQGKSPRKIMVQGVLWWSTPINGRFKVKIMHTKWMTTYQLLVPKSSAGVWSIIGKSVHKQRH